MSTSSLYTNILRGTPMSEITEEEQQLINALAPVPKDYLAAWSNPSEQQFTFFDSSKLPMDIICNGFSMKSVIVNVLDKYNTGYRMDLTEQELDDIAEHIKESFAIHLRLKQG